MTRAHLTAALAAALAVVALAPTAARAAFERAPGPSGWVGVRTGLIVDTRIGGGILDITSRTLLAPAFGVSAEYRFGRVDVGGVFESLGGTTFILEGRRRRLGGQMRGALTLRWRFMEQRWGAVYTRLGIGWAGTRLNDGFRDAVVEAQGDGTERADVSQRAHGITASSAFGLILYPSTRVAAFIEGDVMTELFSMRIDGDRTPLSVTRTSVSVGVIWRL
ncbi:MAG: hypothetical protein H6744_08895 [Deltaproteobacteria bacterium]|nr:hypothetical protein [Deltaproteobacteria bacterium]MCB9786796.1 hypothetical protein [Deltaproteobacteria bacterium]